MKYPFVSFQTWSEHGPDLDQDSGQGPDPDQDPDQDPDTGQVPDTDQGQPGHFNFNF